MTEVRILPASHEVCLKQVAIIQKLQVLKEIQFFLLTSVHILRGRVQFFFSSTFRNINQNASFLPKYFRAAISFWRLTYSCNIKILSVFVHRNYQSYYQFSFLMQSLNNSEYFFTFLIFFDSPCIFPHNSLDCAEDEITILVYKVSD